MECQISGCYDDGGSCYQLKRTKPKARKEHICEECSRKIKPGEHYELYYGVYDDTIFIVKTCLDCLSLRKAFFKTGVVYGAVRDQIADQIIYHLDGDVDSKCILPLTQAAKDFVFDLIEEAWEE